jgi:hypothetical protein
MPKNLFFEEALSDEMMREIARFLLDYHRKRFPPAKASHDTGRT